MGLNFHPRVIGRMAVKDGRNQEMLMLETAAFDPIWTEFNWGRLGRCTVPCIRNYGSVFEGKKNAFPYEDEWESYDGEQKKHIYPPKDHASRKVERAEQYQDDETKSAISTNDKLAKIDKEALANTEYRLEEDNYPPTNRTLENFFRGSWSYHVHNQWLKQPQPSSWFNVIQVAQDGFFAGQRSNPYGEMWNGPPIKPYEISWEFA